MNAPSSNTVRLETIGIIKIALKWWKPLMMVGLSSAILAAIFSSPYFIKPLFKSTAIVYPSNMSSYASENPTEQMIQIFESEDIVYKLIRDFDLFRHYEIDSATEKYPFTMIKGMIGESISVSKTEFESAEITVMDTDPLIASSMCDSIISYLNQKVLSLHRAKYEEVLKTNKKQLDIKKTEMDSMEAAIKILRTNYGILEFEGQVRPFAKEYYKALAVGKAGNGNSKLDEVQHNFAEKGGEYIALKEHLWRTRGLYNDLKDAYEKSLKDLTKEQTYYNMVTSPVPAEKKSYPLRSGIVLGFTAAMLFISFLVILILERSKPSVT